MQHLIRIANNNNKLTFSGIYASSWLLATSCILPQLCADSGENSQIDKKYLTFPYYQVNFDLNFAHTFRHLTM